MIAPAADPVDRGFFGHPRGLSTLFFTEMWERFSYYGMRAFLILYMVAPVAAGGLGFTDAHAASIYGTYTGSAWAASIVGGLIADRLLGQYRTVLIGGVIIAAGHFTLAFKSLPSFYAGLALIVMGTGCLKPNVSTLVGSLYPDGDARRDAGFSIFYMGINLGATLGPLIAGYLAQNVNWHIGFACAGVGMTFGLIQYVIGRDRLKSGIARLDTHASGAGHGAPASGRVGESDGRSPAARVSISEERSPSPRVSTANEPPERSERTKPRASDGVGEFEGRSPSISRSEWKRIAAIVFFFAAAVVFWGAYEQAGSTLNLFADRYTRLQMFGITFPSSWFQSVQPIFVIMLAPVFGWLWVRMGRSEPSVPAKFALGLLFMGLAFAILIPAGAMAQSGAGIRVSPWFLIWSYFVSELGELCVSPIGLSAVTKLAPLRIVGLMMGVWFLSNAFGNKLAGWAAGFFSTVPLHDLFREVTIVLFVAAILMFALVKPIKALMSGVK